MRESLYTLVVIWVNTILNHIDTRVILPSYEGPCMVYRPKWYQKQRYSRTSIPYSYPKMWNPHSRYPMVSQNDDIGPTLVTIFSFYSSFKNKSSLRLSSIVKWHWAIISWHDLLVDAYLWTQSRLLPSTKIQLYGCTTLQMESFFE